MKIPFYLFGTGKYSDLTLKKLADEKMCGYIDNSENKIGTLKNGFVIKSLDEVRKNNSFNTWIVISVNETLEMEIAEQLLGYGITKFVFLDELELLISDDICEVLSRHNIRLMEYYRGIEQRQRERISFFINHVKSQGIVEEKGYKRKRQIMLVDYAKTFFEELYKIDIHPFLTCGNLLGKYRHNGFIPWDDDLDCGLFSEEYDRFIDYCEKKYHVIYIDGTFSNLNIEKELEWIDTELHKNENGFLIVYPMQLQFNIGSNMMERIAIDFWSFDRYSDINFDSHLKLINMLKNDVINGNYSEQFEKIAALKEQEKDYVDKDGKNIYFSLNSGLSVLRTNNRWIDKDIILPLQKVEYEGTMFFAPNKIEDYLQYEFKDIDDLPSDCGVEKHFYRNVYIKSNYLTVEFYLVDAFEIYHFIPLYRLFRKHGVYAIFVAEPESINTAGKWFDYKTAIRILNDLELEYVESCNVDVDVAFTTQFPRNLRKYRRAIKVNMTYGCSFNRNAFWFNETAIRGFDYKLVGGEFIKEKCLAKEILDDEHVLIMGSPKHYGLRDRLDYKANKLLEGGSTNKKILCYFPTWDEDSSIVLFSDVIKEMRKEYYIITKPHHCTFRLPEKKDELEMLYRISDVVLDGNYNFEEVANIGDLRLCDAKSGAALEAMLVNPMIPTIFLSVHENVEEYYYSEITDVAGAVISNPMELQEKAKIVTYKKNIDMNRYFDCSIKEDDLWSILKRILESSDKKGKNA